MNSIIWSGFLFCQWSKIQFLYIITYRYGIVFRQAPQI